MSTRTDDGGSAFPMPYSTDEHDLPCNATVAHPGMSLRDWFAGQALVGLMAKRAPSENPGNRSAEWQGHMAWDAYSIADAMLREREV